MRILTNKKFKRITGQIYLDAFQQGEKSVKGNIALAVKDHNGTVFTEPMNIAGDFKIPGNAYIFGDLTCLRLTTGGSLIVENVEVMGDDGPELSMEIGTSNPDRDWLDEIILKHPGLFEVLNYSPMTITGDCKVVGEFTIGNGESGIPIIEGDINSSEKQG